MNEAVILIAIGFVLQLYLLYYKRNALITVLGGLLLISAVTFYSGHGQWFNIWPKDEVYKEQRGERPLKAYLHWHEVYHYYLGGKYFPELGYNGLYEAVLLADAESSNPQYGQPELRSLRKPTEPIGVEEGLRRAREEHRPKFSDARWLEFTTDVATLKSVAGSGWIDTALYDAGYNPPPSWAVFGYTVANLLPITQAHAFFDGRPSWYQIEFLPVFDVLMLLTALILIYRAFGLEAFALFAFLFCTSYVASYSWISGSFFRYTWLFGLIAGICMLKEKRYFWAGVFLGLSSIDRIFPIVFAAGAVIPLLYDYKKNIKPLQQYIAGGAITVSVIFLISLALFGLGAWGAFFTKIGLHNEMFFVHHIGYKRVAVFDEFVPNQNFWWGDGLRSFAIWNARLNANWDSMKWIHLPFIVMLLGASVLAARRMKPEESALLFGGLVLFFFSIPANYYYIYFPMVAVVIAASDKDNIRTILISAFFLLWAFLHTVRSITKDDLIQNYYVCLGFLMFFIIWCLGRSYAEIRRISR